MIDGLKAQQQHKLSAPVHIPRQVLREMLQPRILTLSLAEMGTAVGAALMPASKKYSIKGEESSARGLLRVNTPEHAEQRCRTQPGDRGERYKMQQNDG